MYILGRSQLANRKKLNMYISGAAYSQKKRIAKYFNKQLRGARVVTEHAYGMLKGRWRILYKKTECRMRNVKYIIMACILLHNLCIELSDPCQPRWRFEVGEFSLMPKQTGRIEDTAASELNRLKISNWLWSH